MTQHKPARITSSEGLPPFTRKPEPAMYPVPIWPFNGLNSDFDFYFRELAGYGDRYITAHQTPITIHIIGRTSSSPPALGASCASSAGADFLPIASRGAPGKGSSRSAWGSTERPRSNRAPEGSGLGSEKQAARDFSRAAVWSGLTSGQSFAISGDDGRPGRRGRAGRPRRARGRSRRRRSRRG